MSGSRSQRPQGRGPRRPPRASRWPRRSLPATRRGRQPRRGVGLSTNKGSYWAWGADTMSMFNTIVPPNSTQYTWGACRFGCNTCGVQSADHSNITNANSTHPGGANAMMADGSVHFIKSSISMQTWWQLGTRADGEVISSDSY